MPTVSASVVLAAFLGLLMGAALSRSNMCLMRAAYDVSKGRFTAFAGVLAASAIGTVVFFMSERAGWHQPAPWTWPTILTVGGAVLFAIGARLNAACSIGTVGRLASGDLGAFATIGGMLLALAVLPRTMIHDDRPAWAGGTQIPLVAAMAALVIALSALAVLRGTVRDLLPAVLLGAIAALLYGLHSQVTWLELATDAFNGTGSWLIAGIGFLCLLIGAFGARHYAGEIQWRWPDGRRFRREFLGGTLMGAGSLFIPGATDALAFYGIPSGSPHAVVAWLVLFGTIVLSFWVFPVDESLVPTFATTAKPSVLAKTAKPSVPAGHHS